MYLARSLDDVFGRAHWRHHLVISPPHEPIVGICVSDNPAGLVIKDNIEVVTNQSIDVRNLSGFIAGLIIGVKPVPSPLPPELRAEAADLGERLKQLSSEVATFAVDRTREEELLPKRGSYPADDGGAEKHWEASVTFNETTKSLYNARFSRATTYLGELANMGITLPFFLQNSEGRPAKLALWFDTVGDLLVNGKINEARVLGNDNHYWSLR